MVRQGHMGTHAVSRQWIFSICVTGQDVMQVTRQSALCVYTVQCTLYIYILIFMSVCTFDGEVGCGNSQYHVLNGLWGWEIFRPRPVAVALLIYATFPHICLPLTFCFVACQPPTLSSFPSPESLSAVFCVSAVRSSPADIALFPPRLKLIGNSSADAAGLLRRSKLYLRANSCWRSLRKTTGRGTTTGLLMKL